MDVLKALEEHFMKYNSRHRSRARKVGAERIDLDWQDVCEIQKEFVNADGELVCPFCKTEFRRIVAGERGGVAFNHWKNLARSKAHDFWHCLLSCSTCNRILWAQHKDDWRAYLESLGFDANDFVTHVMRGSMRASHQKAFAAIDMLGY